MDSLDSAGTKAAPRPLKIRGSPGAEARQRRAEIRRFRVIATNTNLFPEPSFKRRRPYLSPRKLMKKPSANFSLAITGNKSMDSADVLNGWHNQGGDEISGGTSTSFSSGSDRNSDNSGASSAVTTAENMEGMVVDKNEELADGFKALPSSRQLLDGMTVSTLSLGRSPRCVSSDTCPPHGAVYICGRRREMEDAVAIVPSFMTVPCGTVGGCDCKGAVMETPGAAMSTLHFFAVYDGHGGSQVAAHCKEHLHRVLEEEFSGMLLNPNTQHLEAHLQKAMVSSFFKVDAQVGGFSTPGEGHSSPAGSNFIAPETVGSTAVVAVLGCDRIIVANCGDSRAILSRGGRAIPLSVDHKPDRDDELARVEAAGGRVFFWNGYRVLGVLAMSRAIGDRYLKPFIIPEPDVTCTERSDDDECLILASDGLWDVLTNEMACEIARRCLAKHAINRSSSNNPDETAADMAAGLLTKVAIAKGSSDNISVVVVDLRKS